MCSKIETKWNSSNRSRISIQFKDQRIHCWITTFFCWNKIFWAKFFSNSFLLLYRRNDKFVFCIKWLDGGARTWELHFSGGGCESSLKLIFTFFCVWSRKVCIIISPLVTKTWIVQSQILPSKAVSWELASCDPITNEKTQLLQFLIWIWLGKALKVSFYCDVELHGVILQHYRYDINIYDRERMLFWRASMAWFNQK